MQLPLKQCRSICIYLIVYVPECQIPGPKAVEGPSKEAPHPAGFEPADLVKCRPELGSLVHVNLAGLLSIRLAELLAGAQAL